LRLHLAAQEQDQLSPVKKNFTRSRTSNGVNPDYAAETKNKEGKSTPRSLRVVAGSENQTSEKLGGKN
jgi:hypothetical protein